MDAVTGALNKDWENGLCSCFGDFKVCIITMLLPCYTAGKIGDKVPGLSCITAGLLFLIPVVNLIIAFKLRSGIKTVKMINEGMVATCIYSICCPCCALIQEARELGVELPMARE
ncbi:uncharacterized protein LOC134852990 [Symsagittifera roscoffensis]|uniref:uncharacterized protein LOC134852990 n=1 Tax=Symsagittifera roscoffensis TaxID=84072 RepID=UPI00307C476A